MECELCSNSVDRTEEVAVHSHRKIRLCVECLRTLLVSAFEELGALRTNAVYDKVIREINSRGKAPEMMIPSRVRSNMETFQAEMRKRNG